MTLTTRKPRKPLKARTPLSPISAKRRVALAAAGITHPTSTLVSSLPSVLVRQPKMATKASKLPALPKVVKLTGEFSPAVRDAIEDRDVHSCARCGCGVGDRRGEDFCIQHRRARGNGGSSLPDTGQSANGIILCGSALTGCHGEVEERGELDRVRGYYIDQQTDGKPTDPTTVPVLHALYGWCLLDNSGGYERCAAPETAVAA